jgi:hypothetical protein
MPAAGPGNERFQKALIWHFTRPERRWSIPEHHRVHDAARIEGEEPGDDEGAGKYARSCVAVAADVMPTGMQDRMRKHHQREDRQQMDGAPRPPHAQVVDPETKWSPRSPSARPMSTRLCDEAAYLSARQAEPRRARARPRPRRHEPAPRGQRLGVAQATRHVSGAAAAEHMRRVPGRSPGNCC